MGNNLELHKFVMKSFWKN